jgi:hypothetical protein
MLSSKAGGYMNGGFLTLDGGRLMVRSPSELKGVCVADSFVQGASINDGLRMPEDTYNN